MTDLTPLKVLLMISDFPCEGRKSYVESGSRGLFFDFFSSDTMWLKSDDKAQDLSTLVQSPLDRFLSSVLCVVFFTVTEGRQKESAVCLANTGGERRSYC